MKHLILLVLAFAPIATHAAEIPLDAALAAASERPPVVDARLTLEDAVRTADRTAADPVALRLDRLQADQGVQLAQRSLAQARFEAYAQIARAYTQALESERQVALAELALDLSRRSLEIARIRFERGSATELDVQNAATEVARSEATVASARQGLSLARDSLASLIDVEDPRPQPIPDTVLAVPPPDLATVREGVADHPTVVQARQGVEAARVARDLLDPSYASRVQIEQAELRIDRAEEGLEEARRGLELQATQLHDAVQNALDRLAVERGALEDMREREAQEAQRFDAGLIAEIALEQVRLSRAQAEIAVAQAEHSVLRALFDLQAGTVTPIEGLDAF